MRRLAIALTLLTLAAPLAAQDRDMAASTEQPALAFRPFFLVSAQRFAARRTFDAAFGGQVQPFWGGGVEAILRGRFFLNFTVSRFQKTGQRAFITDTASFPLGIPLTATMMPIEVAGGYRFRHPQRVVPYVGAGFGAYSYREVSPEPFSDPTENVDTSRTGLLLLGGVDLRLHRWIGAAVDVQYTRVRGILGQDGLSELAGEDDLGGASVRVRVLLGK